MQIIYMYVPWKNMVKKNEPTNNRNLQSHPIQLHWSGLCYKPEHFMWSHCITIFPWPPDFLSWVFPPTHPWVPLQYASPSTQPTSFIDTTINWDLHKKLHPLSYSLTYWFLATKYQESNFHTSQALSAEKLQVKWYMVFLMYCAEDW